MKTYRCAERGCAIPGDLQSVDLCPICNNPLRIIVEGDDDPPGHTPDDSDTHPTGEDSPTSPSGDSTPVNPAPRKRRS